MRSTILLWLITGVSILFLAGVALTAGDWQSTDIGDSLAGSTDITDGVITITANGADIWGSADACRYVYKEVTGDFEMSARVVSMESVNAWSKAGIMARQSLDADSQHCYINVTIENGAKMIHRDTPGADTGPSPFEPNFAAPIWLKLVRKGDEFSSFWSEDGVQWDPADVESADGVTPSVATVVMTDPILVGIAYTSHVAGTLSTAVVDNIEGSPEIVTPVKRAGSKAAKWAELKAEQ
jgi:hypothetical protein